MLCNRCGHHRLHHTYSCIIKGCGCLEFIPPGDADAYESTRELVKGAMDETRESVRSLPEELFVLRKLARKMADLLEDAMYAGELHTHSDKALEATWQDCRREVLAAYRTATSKGKEANDERRIP